jgi:deoxyribodipyrimidine photo-lyase
MSAEPVQVVWFKRDLRVRDHPALAAAGERGPLICLYVYEPELIASAEFDAQHLEFINEALAELDQSLRALGARLVTRVGEVTAVLEALWRERRFEALWSHEETGQGITYARDVRVGAWCRERGVRWTELPQNGVVRRLRNRDGWAARWERRALVPVLAVPLGLKGVRGVRSEGRKEPGDFGLAPSGKDRQRGGETVAGETLASFLNGRGVNYRTEMSSPLTGGEACSRISPYLTWGCVSVRQVEQEAVAAMERWREAMASGVAVERAWFASLKSFRARLRWHCHFMQKLEDEPGLEFRNLHRGYDGLREEMAGSEEGRRRLEAWKAGQTGYPMVDACMRSCLATGWLNFRMRAMLASFAAYHLWLHWREPAVFLARHFLDFEPGIHFSQFQMQSGTTGINTLRIYSPAKQALDQDPEGRFIRRWVPELERVPTVWLAEPWRMPENAQRAAGCVIGKDYPPPIVDHKAAWHQARAAFAEVRRRAEVRAEARRVYERHGSRKEPRRPEFGEGRSQREKKLPLESQGELELS